MVNESNLFNPDAIERQLAHVPQNRIRSAYNRAQYWDERAAKVHADFVSIHPFIDANGRTSRLLMNLELMKAGYPSCVITVENRLAYYEALDQWMAHGKTEAFFQLVSNAVLDGFKPYQVVLGI